MHYTYKIASINTSKGKQSWFSSSSKAKKFDYLDEKEDFQSFIIADAGTVKVIFFSASDATFHKIDLLFIGPNRLFFCLFNRRLCMFWRPIRPRIGPSPWPSCPENGPNFCTFRRPLRFPRLSRGKNGYVRRSEKWTVAILNNIQEEQIINGPTSIYRFNNVVVVILSRLIGGL